VKKRLFWQPLLMAGLFLSLTSPASAGVLFALIPSDGDVSGPPGSLVGWGYSLQNTDPSNWFESTNLNSDSFANGTPMLLFDFPILAPGDTVTEPFDSVNSTGLSELQWNPLAPDAFTNSGNFTLSGQWFDGDPLNGGNFVADAPDIALPYSASVTGTTGGVVPEPSGFVLLLIGIGALAAIQLRPLFAEYLRNLRRSRRAVSAILSDPCQVPRTSRQASAAVRGRSWPSVRECFAIPDRGRA
jgi:hypothetical protein